MVERGCLLIPTHIITTRQPVFTATCVTMLTDTGGSVSCGDLVGSGVRGHVTFEHHIQGAGLVVAKGEEILRGRKTWQAECVLANPTRI